jgi:hypothetical protein
LIYSLKLIDVVLKGKKKEEEEEEEEEEEGWRRRRRKKILTRRHPAMDFPSTLVWSQLMRLNKMWCKRKATATNRVRSRPVKL